MSPVDPALPAVALPASSRPRRPRPLPAIDTQRCTGCGRCVAACDPHILSLEVQRWKKSAVLHDAERCTGCSRCALVCPFDAISMRAPAGPATREQGDGRRRRP